MYPDLAWMLSTLHGQIGMIYTQLEDNNKAFEYLNQANSYDDTNIANWINMACLDLKVGRLDSCMQICERILLVDSTNERAFELKGDLH
jgi:tetratricopeptide (TPR) repeat protein